MSFNTHSLAPTQSSLPPPWLYEQTSFDPRVSLIFSVASCSMHMMQPPPPVEDLFKKKMDEWIQVISDPLEKMERKRLMEQFIQSKKYRNTELIVSEYARLQEIPFELLGTHQLMELTLSKCANMKIFQSPKTLKKLCFLMIKHCDHLEKMEISSDLSNLISLKVSCPRLKTCNIMGKMPYLVQLQLSSSEMTSLCAESLSQLTDLHLDCPNLRDLKLPSNASHLKKMYIHSQSLISVKLPKESQSLEELKISCPIAASLDLPETLSQLRTVQLCCTNLKVPVISKNWTRLNYLYLQCPWLLSLSIPKEITRLETVKLERCFRLHSLEIDTKRKKPPKVALSKCPHLR